MGKGKKDKKNAKKSKNKAAKALAAQPLGVAPTYTAQSDVTDFLDETDVKSFERFGCIMFAAPEESMREHFKEQIAADIGVDAAVVSKVVDAFVALEHPKRAFKYVGGRETVEECKTVIQRVMEEDQTFHVFTMENGKWCTYDPSPELIEDENFREKQLNDIIRSKKVGEQRSKDFFRSEMRKKVEKARLEGTKEGQQLLLEAEEPFQAVEFRAQSAAENIAEMKEKIAEQERTRELALRKMEEMRAAGKDKPEVVEQQRAQMEDKLKSIELPSPSQVIKDKLKDLDAIESGRFYPDDLARVTAQKMQQSEAPPAPAAPEIAGNMFDDAPIIPSAIADKGKEEANAAE